jgi:hypothetical protein
LVAAHEAGLDLARVALVPNLGGELVAVTSALLDGGLAGTLGGWQGIGAGHCRLRSRRVQVRLTGRGSAQRGARTSLLLSGPTGASTQIVS